MKGWKCSYDKVDKWGASDTTTASFLIIAPNLKEARSMHRAWIRVTELGCTDRYKLVVMPMELINTETANIVRL